MHLPETVPEIMRILRRFETTNNSVGAASTHMWLLPYLPYVGEKEHGSIDFKYRYLPEFFKLQEYRRWSHFVNLGDHADCLAERPSCLQKFVFSTGFHNAVTWTERLNLLEQWRNIASEYRHLNLTVYEDFSMYSDQLLSIVPVTQQTVFFALVCMLIVLTLFTPSPVTIVTSSCSVLSINLGVFGCLVYLDIDLDPISMTTLLMAIGFSVDFVAHITWHYYKGDFPVVVLVIFLGMCHGLIVLPVVFAALPFKKATINNSKEKPHVLSIVDVKHNGLRQAGQA
ncbi:hypothetical protein OESDEN_00337 [Oesophagostomum dentatum]|uniref:Patched family protein n=2 Tax=Strongyloidea TaxID=27829 RepID=A0A0B1TQ95_OESDE|nr:hypothetical protein OESDEN_00337 [Oesophagostomum dentatum]